VADRILVAGLGRFGQAVARKMMELGHEVCGVDIDAHLVAQLQHELTMALVADLTDQEAVQEIVGAQNYDLAVVAIGTGLEASMRTALYLREAGVPKIVAKATSPTHGRLLEAIKVDRVVYPEREAGEQLALELGRKRVIRSLKLAAGLEVVEAEPPASLVGKTLSVLALRPRYGVTVLTIERGEDCLTNVGPDTEIRAGDKLMLLGQSKDLARLLERWS
jgi:trk system potassium uptake protein TrkA